MIKDYNEDLLDALNKFFWYNGYLEEDGDELVYFGDFARPKYKKDCVIIELIERLRNHKDTIFSLKDMQIIENKYEYPYTEFNVIWIILVSMFGDYGTSPRSGWITDFNGCADFLETIVEIQELTFLKNKED